MLKVIEPQTYRKDGEHSYFRDLTLSALDDDDAAMERLRRHAIDVEHWTGDDRWLAQLEPDEACSQCGHRSTVRGNYATPPLWLLQQAPQLLAEHRPYINAMQVGPLPPGTDSINIPTIACTPAREEMLNSGNYISAPVRTCVGQQTNNPKLIRELPASLDAVIFAELVADYAANTSRLVITGTGSNGHPLGIHNTPRINCFRVTEQASGRTIYNTISDAIEIIQEHRFLPPEYIIMHPDRWEKLSAFDKFKTGRLHDLHVITDNAMPTRVIDGDGPSELIHVARTTDIVMWESALRCRALPDDNDARLQVYAYSAFSAGRYPQSIAEISLTTT